ncbi:MAG: glycosyltransferase family 2 protein [bacterium]|nr:glycosyltransferase family 2 protein [bacterium]
MISILIVNYNTDDHLRGCLRSLSRHREVSHYEITVINNGKALRGGDVGHGLDIRLVNNKRNIGYAAALNQGAELTHCPYILCLNADTRLPADSLSPLVEYLRGHPEAGVVAPRLLYPNGSLQYSCRRDYTCGSILGRRLPFGSLPMVEPALRQHLMLDEDHSRILQPDWVQGSCLMLPRTVFDQIGGFDGNYFLYFEDYDLCHRVRQAGLKIVYLPESDVIHYYARSSANLGIFHREFWHHLASACRFYGGFLRTDIEEPVTTSERVC